MSQPTPKPLSDRVHAYLNPTTEQDHHCCAWCGSAVNVPVGMEWNDGDWCDRCAHDLLRDLAPAYDNLRAAVAEAEKQRDMEKGWKDAQTRGNQRLSQEVHALQEANQRLMVKLADKFAESGEGVEVLIASRDALAAELADAKAALRAVRIELAALVADPENPDWRLFHPEIREPDAKCLTDAYDAARAAASKPANETAWLIERGQPEGQSPTLWWTGSNWMDRAADAWRYGTKGEAEAELTKRSGVKGLQYHGVFGRVVEHIFIGKEPANDAARELDAGGGGGA